MAAAEVNVQHGTVEKARDIDFAWVNYDLPKLRVAVGEGAFDQLADPQVCP